MTNPNTGWAPVVHGRTYRVDFRPHLLVVPDWFDDDHNDTAVAREFIRASTRSAERLPDGPRWLMVKTDRFLMAGVTCMATAVSADMTHDRPDPGSGGTGRPLYVFLGYATRDLDADPLPMDLEVYKPLYQSVRDRWDNAPPDDAPQEGGAMIESVRKPIADFKNEELTPDLVNPSSLDSVIRICPDSQRAALWTAVARHRGQVSLCIGMARPRDAEDTPLGNITVAGSDEPGTLQRKPKPAIAGDPIHETRASPHNGEATAKVPPRPRRRPVSFSVINFILKALDAILRMLGLHGGPQLRALPAPTPRVVGTGDILRPARPTTRRPKANVFAAFGDPPSDSGKDSPIPPSQNTSNDEQLEASSADANTKPADDIEKSAPSIQSTRVDSPPVEAVQRSTNDDLLEKQRRMNLESRPREETGS